MQFKCTVLKKKTAPEFKCEKRAFNMMWSLQTTVWLAQLSGLNDSKAEAGLWWRPPVTGLSFTLWLAPLYKYICRTFRGVYYLIVLHVMSACNYVLRCLDGNGQPPWTRAKFWVSNQCCNHLPSRSVDHHLNSIFHFEALTTVQTVSIFCFSNFIFHM